MLAATEIVVALSEYANKKQATAMFSQDENQGTFSISTVINFTSEATEFINHTAVDCFIPPPPPPSAATLHG